MSGGQLALVMAKVTTTNHCGQNIGNHKVDYCFVSDDVIVSLFIALPPSKAILRNVFVNTRDLNRLCIHLNIPRDERDVDSAVEYFAQDTDQIKMRRMIWELDQVGDTALADSVMEFAEPPAGMTAVNIAHP